jgi:DNA repair protein RecO (recombination protein O)
VGGGEAERQPLFLLCLATAMGGMQPMNSRERSYRVRAVVLRRVSTGETDRVVTLFTREHGKIGAIAKGARGARSRLGAATEPGICFRGLLAVGQNLEVLTQAEVIETYPALRRDLTRLGYASYFLELVDAAVEDRQPAPDVWDLLTSALGALETIETPDLLARALELRLLDHLGLLPDLSCCVLDGGSLPEEAALFHPKRGGLICPRCAVTNHGAVRITDETLTALRTLACRGLGAILPPATPPSERARAELARVLAPTMRAHLDAPLRSLQFLDAVV